MSRLQHLVREVAELDAIRPGVLLDVAPEWSSGEWVRVLVERAVPPLQHQQESRWVSGLDQTGRWRDVYVALAP